MTKRIIKRRPLALRWWAWFCLVWIVTDGAQLHAQRFRYRESPSNPNQWELKEGFTHDVFTFVRIRYSSGGGRYGRYGRGDWRTDYPDAEWNFAYRLQQMTSLKVHPEGKVMTLTDPDLFDYPFIYIVEPGDLRFSEAEVKTLRQYLLNGGFLMVDDFWGQAEWYNFYREIKRAFPDREPEEVPLEHPIFNCVFQLNEKPQVPNVRTGYLSQFNGVTWERSDAKTPHYKALYDDDGRMMAFICHNTDLGDGWEREGENEYYFREFSEKKAYPLGINIVFYAMTH
jgi:hypothetical protein